MIRTMIVDDEALVRSGLELILGAADDIEVVATSEGGQALDAARQHRPDVVLLDIRMPDIDGLTVLRSLCALPQPPAIAMLTTFDADEHVARALRCGAAGFLLKDTEPDQLVHSVRVLAAGGNVLSPTVMRTVIAGYLDGGVDGAVAGRIATMTQREKDVLALLGEGLANAEIGQRLCLSVATVKEHVSAILGKLRASNRVQAAVIAHQAGLVGSVPGDRR